MRRLLQPINRALQLAHMRWILGVFETGGGLLHVNILRHIAMEKSIAHINLTPCPTTRDNKGEN
jgi:hypothetical protein